MPTIEITVNGEARRLGVEAGETLLDALRERLALKGVRFGCGAAQCGSCAVLVDGEVTASCAMEAAAAAGRSVLTVEGLGTPQRPHPLQAAFLELQAGQCGYCLSGILIGAKALLDRNPQPSRRQIAEALSWHLCRCGAHNRIVRAVLRAARDNR